MRKSTRVSIPTERARAFNALSNSSFSPFPAVTDEIKVKWDVDGRVVWWSATVLSISTTGAHQREGELLYHPHASYKTEISPVVFFNHNLTKCARFVATVDRSSADYSSTNSKASWITATETIPTEPNPSHNSKAGWPDKSFVPQTAGKSRKRHSLPVKGSNSKPENLNSHRRLSTTTRIEKRSDQSSFRVSGLGILDTQSNSPQTNETKTVPKQRGRRFGRRTVLQKPHGTSTQTPISDNDIQTEPDPSALDSPVPQSSLAFDSVNLPSGTAAVQTDHSALANQFDQLQTKILYLEDRIKQISTTTTTSESSPCLSTTTLGVLMSLKWSLLKRLEKPLKEVKHRDLDTMGICSDTLVVKCDCDSSTFRDLTAYLVKKYNVRSQSNSAESRNLHRVAFSPSYSTILDASTSSDNLVIAFQTLSDITDLLAIRNEEDYEFMLTKELITNKVSIIRFLGSFSTSSLREFQSDHSSGSHSSAQITSDSLSVPIIQVFIGTSIQEDRDHPRSTVTTTIASTQTPEQKNLTLESNKGADEHSVICTETPQTPHTPSFITVVFQQECRHFNLDQKCFRSSWNFHRTTHSYHFKSNKISPSTTDTSLFTFRWTKAQTPSTKKWSNDVHVTTVDVPGQISLSIPYVLSCSRYNVTSLSKLLDIHIECFIEQRSQLRSTQANVTS